MKKRALRHAYQEVILFQNGAIGDFLMSVFLAEQLHRAEVAPKVTIAVPRNSAFLKTFIGSYPYIQVIQVARSSPLSAFRLAPFFRPGILSVLQPTPGRVPRQVKWVAWLLTRMPGSLLVGFSDGDGLADALYGITLPYDTDIPFLDTLRSIAFALSADEGMPAVPSIDIIPDAHIRSALQLEGKRYLFIHPRGSSEKRSFEPASALVLLDALLAHSPELMIVISGSPSEREWVGTLIARSTDPERCIAACGMNGPQLVALIEKAVLFIGVDTGITHLACFLGRPVLAVAHKGTANWLPFYHPGARVLYRLQEDSETHEDKAYLDAHRAGRLKPFGTVPTEASIRAAKEILSR